MNIAEIKQQGEIDSWIDFTGQIIEIKETKSRTKKKRLMTKVKLKDESGEIIGVWLYTENSQCVPNQIITANGMLKEYEDHKYIDYATVKVGQNAPQPAPQSPQEPAQSTNPPQTQSNAPTWQVLDREHVEKDVICALLASRKRPEPEEVKVWVDYIMDGIHPDSKPQDNNNPEYSDDPPKTKDSDIPF